MIRPTHRFIAAPLAAVLLMAGCGGSTPAPTPAGPTLSAREAYDEAVIAALDGDAITYRDRLVQLAAAHPETPYARAALAQLGGAGGLPLLALVGAVPMFWLGTESEVEGPIEESPDLDEIDPQETL